MKLKMALSRTAMLAALLAALAAAPVRAADVESGTWSETDSSNTSLSPYPGWPSSTMLPTQVEPSGRAMMGAVKRFRDRVDGLLTSSGSAGSYALSYSVAPGAYVQGQKFTFRANFTSVGGDTLNVNSLGALPLYKPSASGPVAIAANDIQSGQMVEVSYDSNLDSSGGGFHVLEGLSPFAGTAGGDLSGAYPNPTVAKLNGVPAGSALRSYLAGLTLSNDATTPNSVLDVAAGTATDSTNSVQIVLGAFTKSTAGSWSAGSGQNGMGNGLTIANSTWYDVCEANNGGTPDIWFDTSNRSSTYSECANRPSGISDTKYRRIGSFKTDGSAHVVAFIQDGNLFQWAATALDVNSTNQGTSAVTDTLSVPTGFHVQAYVQSIVFNNGAGGVTYSKLSDLATNDEASGQSNTDTTAAESAAGAAGIAAARVYVRTNTSAQVRDRISYSDGNVTRYIRTLGWIDTRGRDN